MSSPYTNESMTQASFNAVAQLTLLLNMLGRLRQYYELVHRQTKCAPLICL